MPTDSPERPLYNCAYFPNRCHVTDLTAAEFRCHSCKRLQPERTPEVYANPTMNCGHHISLLIRSVESDHQYCALCEVQSRLRDAIEMELAYKSRNATLTRQLETARTAMARVIAWDGFPAVTDRNGNPSRYGWEYGSNGERDFMRHVLRDALAAIDAPPADAAKCPFISMDDPIHGGWTLRYSDDGGVSSTFVASFFIGEDAGRFASRIAELLNRFPIDKPVYGTPPCPDCSQDAGGVAKVCAKHSSTGHTVYRHRLQRQPSAPDPAEPFSAEPPLDYWARVIDTAISELHLLSGDDPPRNRSVLPLTVTLATIADLIRRGAVAPVRGNEGDGS